MDIRQLQYLVAIVDHGGVGKAAKHLRVTQSALSQSVGRLESELQLKLFDRTSNGLVLTRYGDTVVARARNITREALSTLSDLDALRRTARNNLVVGASPTLASRLVPDVLLQLSITRPKLSISILEGPLDTLTDGLLRGEIDLAILAFDDTVQARHLVSESVFKDRLGIVARKDHPLRRKADVQLADCVPYPWVLPMRSHQIRRRMEAVFSQAGLEAPVPHIETGVASAIKHIVAASDHLTFLPYDLIEQEERLGLLAPLPIESAETSRTIHVVYVQGKSLSKSALVLIDIIRRSVPTTAGISHA